MVIVTFRFFDAGQAQDFSTTKGKNIAVPLVISAAFSAIEQNLFVPKHIFLQSA
jgi:hypothetical protein